MHVWTNQVCFKKSALFTGIQASPPQKPEMKEAPVSVQSSPLQGQNVLSFSPARPSSTSPKFSPSCVSGFSPPLSSSSAGGPFSPSMVFDQVEYFEMLKLYFWYFILFTHPLLLHLQVLNYSPSPSSSPYPSNLGPAEGTSLRARYRTSPSVFNSPGGKEDYIDDLKTLEKFLRTEEEKSHRSQLGKSPDWTSRCWIKLWLC